MALFGEAAAAALAAYGLAADAVVIERLSFVSNAVFKVRADRGGSGEGQFALRIHHPDLVQPEAVEAELEWLRAIRRDAALRTPHPVAAGDGAYLVEVWLPHAALRFHCVLFEWLEGRYLRTSEQTADDAYQVGRFAGALHQQSSGFSAGAALARARLDADFLAEQRRLMAGEEGGRLFTLGHRRLARMVEERARGVFDWLGEGPEEFGLIHTDLIWKNYFFHQGGAGAVDFDDCRWGYYLYDLAPPLSGYRDERHYLALREGLLAGYQSVYALPAGYEEPLDTLIAARHLVEFGWLLRHLEHPMLRARAAEIVAYRTGQICELLGVLGIDG
jgi:Ser/Thr protein kinase RdoA (MazF antagonist)